MPTSTHTSGRKIVETINQHEDHPGQTLATKEHDVILRWAQERDAQPAAIPETGHDRDAGAPGLVFPGGEETPRISWDEWFKIFDRRDLTFVYQEHLRNGNLSSFFKLDTPDC